MSALQVYVQLVGEAVDCWRPVQHRDMGEGIVEILGIVPAGEEWQFVPGSKVRCRKRRFAYGKEGLMAYEPAAL